MQCCICTCCHWQNLFASDAICVSVPGTADVTGADRAEWVFTADRAVNDRWAEHSDQWILGLQSLWHDCQPPRQRPVSFYHSEILCYLHYCIIIIIIIHEFHRDTSLEQNFRAAVCHYTTAVMSMLWPIVCVAVWSAEQFRLQCTLECPHKSPYNMIDRGVTMRLCFVNSCLTASLHRLVS